MNKLLKGKFLNYLELNAFNDGDDGEHYLILRSHNTELKITTQTIKQDWP